MLNRADFPEMSDEQWKSIQAEADRRATDATHTAKRGLLTPEEVAAKIEEAVTAKKAELEADEAGKLEIQRKAIDERERAFKAEQRAFKAKTKLIAAGLDETKVENLLPLFAGVDDTALDTSLDTFITTYQEGVKTQVDAEKIALLGGAKPPKGSTHAATDAETSSVTLAQKGDDAGAAQVLLAEAGLV